MTIRLVICDVDGTLLNAAKEVTPDTIEAIALLRHAGIGFTIISARPPSGLLPLVSVLALSEPFAAFNGGTLCRNDGSILERHTLPAEVLQGLFDLADRPGLEPWIYADGIWHARTLDGPHTESERRSSMQEPVRITGVSQLGGPVDKLTWVSDDEPLLKSLTEKARSHFGQAATITQSQAYYLDMTNLKANKGDGIATLARSLGVPLCEVAVLGDQWNDVSMFKRAGLSIAMGQAPLEVKAEADFVTASNDENGVARAVRTILLPFVDGLLGDEVIAW